MNIDYQALLYNPIYSRIGVAATVTPVTGLDVQVTVLDKTAGVEVALSDNVQISSIKPAAAVRMAELDDNDLEPADIDGGTITFNGKTWDIRGFLLKPSPNGESDGEAWLFLQE